MQKESGVWLGRAFTLITILHVSRLFVATITGEIQLLAIELQKLSTAWGSLKTAFWS